jgi:cold shock CspA family protein
MAFKDKLVYCETSRRSFFDTVRNQRQRAERGEASDQVAYCSICRANVRLAAVPADEADEAEGDIAISALVLDGCAFQSLDMATGISAAASGDLGAQRNQPDRRGDDSSERSGNRRPRGRRRGGSGRSGKGEGRQESPPSQDDASPRTEAASDGDRQQDSSNQGSGGQGSDSQSGDRRRGGSGRRGGERGDRGGRSGGGRSGGGRSRGGGGRDGDRRRGGGGRGRREAPRQTDLRIRHVGTVKWFNPDKGYGFIAQDDGSDLFVHASSVLGKLEMELYEGQPVEYEVESAQRGQHAVYVVPLA